MSTPVKLEIVYVVKETNRLEDDLRGGTITKTDRTLWRTHTFNGKPFGPDVKAATFMSWEEGEMFLAWLHAQEKK